MLRIAADLKSHCAVARRLQGRPAVTLQDLAGRKVALSIRPLTIRVPASGLKGAPRLRNDQVVARVRGVLEVALAAAIPDRQAVVVAVTAPIRQPAQTAIAIAARVRSCLRERSRTTDITADIHGNQVRISLMTNVPGRMAKLLLYVHQDFYAANALMHLTRSLITALGSASRSHARSDATAEPWLVLDSPDAALPVALCREILAQLVLGTEFVRIYLCRAGAAIDLLT